MTHHKCWGGRGMELLLLFLLIGVSVALIVGGFILTLRLGLGAAKAPLAGAGVGGVIAGLLWLRFLEFYRYDRNTLRPIEKEEEK